MRLNSILVFTLLLALNVNISGQKKQVVSSDDYHGFRASVVKINITPDNSQNLLGYSDRKSTGIHDSIYHRIVALDDGNTQFFLVSSDICEFSPYQYDRIVTLVEKQLGIKSLNLWWAATHTHSAPELGPLGLEYVLLGDTFDHDFDVGYQSFVEEKLIQGIKEAVHKLSPARLGAGWGFSRANINRRAKDIDGKSTIGLNPDGPVDRRIGLLRIETEEGKPMALIANYPLHGTVLGGESLEISGDVPGVVSEYVEKKTGVPLLFINGALGNLAPIYSVYPDPVSGHLGQFRVLLGDKILEANSKILATSNEVKLNAGSIILETPRKEGLGWAPEIKKYTRTTKDGVNLVRLPIQFLKINEDIAIWSAPVELFCEISNEIRDSSPFPFTFYFGLTNGWLGYFLPESEFKYGGYETIATPYTPDAAKELIEAVGSYLQDDMRNSGPFN